MTPAVQILRESLLARREAYASYRAARATGHDSETAWWLNRCKEWKGRCIQRIRTVESALGRPHRPLQSIRKPWRYV